MQKNAETMAKREQLKEMLEKQGLLEAKAKAPLLAEREKQLGAVPKQGKKGKGKKSKGNTPKVMSPEPKTPKVQSPEPKTPKVMSPEPTEKEKGQLDAAMPKSERKEAIIKRMEQMEKEQVKREKEKMTEEEVKKMVENVEGKCKTVKSDMADMAMTEQYLRTKQALLT